MTRLSIVGGTQSAFDAWQAWQHIPDVTLTSFAPDTPLESLFSASGDSLPTSGSISVVPEEIDLLELCAPNNETLSLANKVLDAGGAVLLHRPLPEPWEHALLAKNSRKVLLHEPTLFHPFFVRALKEFPQELGTFQHIRIKTSLCSSTAHRDDELQGIMQELAGEEFRHPALDRVLPCEAFMGPIVEVFAEQGPQVWHTSLRFHDPGRYGFLETINTPLISISSGYPIEETIEVSGCDGIGWLRNLRGQIVEAPRYRFKRKNRTVSLDDEARYSPLQIEISIRQELVQMFAGNRKPRVSTNSLIRLQKIHQAIAQSARTHQRVTVAP